MGLSSLPTLNAILNSVSAILLVFGFVNIKRGKPDIHKRFMISALISSALFLTSYVIYHYQAGSVPYQHHDWTRPVYFAILIPHVLLAALMTPFIIAAVILAFRQRFDTHKKITRWLWPVWMFVSVSGVVIYLMLYKYR
jgi:putative membrane protein